MAEDMDERIQFNSDILAERGDLIDRAMAWLWKTPAIAAVAALAAAAIASAFNQVGSD
jgi:hypothetical protein